MSFQLWNKFNIMSRKIVLWVHQFWTRLLLVWKFISPFHHRKMEYNISLFYHSKMLKRISPFHHSKMEKSTSPQQNRKGRVSGYTDLDPSLIDLSPKKNKRHNKKRHHKHRKGDSSDPSSSDDYDSSDDSDYRYKRRKRKIDQIGDPIILCAC